MTEQRIEAEAGGHDLGRGFPCLGKGENVAFAAFMPRRKKPHERPNQQNGKNKLAGKNTPQNIRKNYDTFDEIPQQSTAVAMRDLNH